MENPKLSVMLNAQQPNVIQGSSVQTITVNIVKTLPILSPDNSPGFSYINTGKSRNVGKHICAHCGRDCLKPSVLEKHIRSHTGERPFPCTTCGISFKTQSNLYKHRKTQTHVNNIKLNLPSDCGGYLKDQGGEQAKDICVYTGRPSSSDTRFSLPENTCPSVHSNDDVYAQTNKLQSDHGSSEKTVGEHPPSLAIISTTVPNQRKTLKDQSSPSGSRQFQLHRQFETCVEKQWEHSPSKHKLKKCESTDSGYLSHSDSADLQMFSGSPLHSLSECSIESEHALSTSSRHAASEDGEDKAVAGKKTLEEHIAMLISRNQALVDDTHLDNVRPRKTTLSKQGSIDLPMPYTFKDSFHFDMKSFDSNRKKATPCCTKSALNPTEKSKPLCFHSVPTQFSTTLETLTMPRCNSLPFVESCWLTSGTQAYKSLPNAKQPLDISFAGLLLTNNASTCTVDFCSSHPRGLVRQTAVDEVPANASTECYFPEVAKNKKRPSSAHSASKCKAASKKGGSKKATMFSQEKWQMYGDETFRKLYQNVEKSGSARKSKPETAEQQRSADDEKQIANNDGNLTKSSIGSRSPKHVGNAASVAREQESSLDKETQLPEGNRPKSSNVTQGSTALHSGIDCDYPVESEVTVITSCDKQATNPPPSSKNEFPQPPLKDQSACVNSTHLTLKDTDREPSAHAEIGRQTSLNSPENSHSERKKLKVSEIRENSGDGPLRISETIGGKDIQGSLVGKSPLEQPLKANVNSGGIVSGKAGFELNKDRDSQVLDGDLFDLPSPANVTCSAQGSVVGLCTSGHCSQLSAGSPVLNKNAFSPRYIIKLRHGGPTAEESAGLGAEQDHVCGMSFEETDVESLESMHFKERSSSEFGTLCQTEPVKAYTSVDTFRVIHTEESLNVHSPIPRPVPTSSHRVSSTQDCDRNTSHCIKSEEKQTTDILNTAVQMASRVSSLLVISQKDDCSEETHVRANWYEHEKISPTINPSDKLHDKPGMGSTSRHNETTGLVTGRSQECRIITNNLPSQTYRNQQAKPSAAQDTGRAMRPLVLNSGSNKVQASEVSFSVFKTEPNPTWCWLNRCVPLPSEQKDKSFSIYATVSCNTLESKGTGSGAQTRSPGSRPDSSLNSAKNMSSLAWRSQRNKGPLREAAHGVHSWLHAEEARSKGTDFSHIQTSTKRSGRTKNRLQKRRSVFLQRNSHTFSSSKHVQPTNMQVETSHQTINDHKQQEKGFFKRTSVNRAGNLSGEIRSRRVSPGISTGNRTHSEEDTFAAEKARPTAGDENSLKAPSSITPDMAQTARDATDVPPRTSSDADHPGLLKETSFNLHISMSHIEVKETHLQERSGDDSQDRLKTEIKQVHQTQDLQDFPPQKHGRRVLQRSKTIKPSLADRAIPEKSVMMSGTIISRSTSPAVATCTDSLHKAADSKLSSYLESVTRQVPSGVTLNLEPSHKCTAPTLTACMGSLTWTTTSIVTPSSESTPQPPISKFTSCSTVSLVIPCAQSLPQPLVSMPTSSSDNRPTLSTLPPCLKPLARATAPISNRHIAEPSDVMATQHSVLLSKPTAPVIIGCAEPIIGSTIPVVIPCMEPLKGNADAMVVPCYETLARSALQLFTLCSETMPNVQMGTAMSEVTSSPTETTVQSCSESLPALNKNMGADNSGAVTQATQSVLTPWLEPISRLSGTAVTSSSEPTARLHSEPLERLDAVNSYSLQDPLHVLSQSVDSTSIGCLGPIMSNISGSTNPQDRETQLQIGATETPGQQHPIRFHTMTFASQKRLNLEVMRKHTRVEYSDTSSDDEDRLVIEM